MTITPFGTQNSYDINWTVYLNQIEALGITVLRDGVPVQPPRNYFIPSEGETVRLDYSLDAGEPTVSFFVVQATQEEEPKVVFASNMGSQNGGHHAVVWDGKDSSANLAPPGDYVLAIVAIAEANSDIFRPASIFAFKKVELREFGGG